MLYSVRSLPRGGYRITKFDQFLFVLASYEVKGRSCTCPAYRWCKHPDMVQTFAKFGKINTGEFYDAEGERWMPALTTEPVEIRRLG